MLRLTETRGSRAWPASRQAVRNASICSACWRCSGWPLSSNFRVERLHVHAQRRRPCRGRIRGGAPPDAVTQAGGMRLEAQEARWIREHRPWIRLREAIPREELQEDLALPAGHGSVVLALGRDVAEVAVALDDLLRRSAADPELQATAGDQVGRARVLGHVVRVLVAHVDDRRPDLDAAGPRPDRGQQREGRCELPREVMHAEIGAVRAELFGGDRQLDRLQKRVGRRSRARGRRARSSARTTGTRCASRADSTDRSGRPNHGR